MPISKTLSHAHKGTHLGSFLRMFLKGIPKKLIVPVIQGPSRGMRWVTGSGNHSYWLGIYEYEKRRFVESLISPGTVVYDVGANVGYYTMIFSALVGEKGRVIAFEPQPRNAASLRRHVQMNKRLNVEIHECALADEIGIAYFMDGNHNTQGHLSETGGYEVRITTLDEMWSSGSIPNPNYLKIDVEGAELRVLHGSHQLLAETRPTILLATHGRDMYEKCVDFLHNEGYKIEASDTSSEDTCWELYAVPKSAE